MNKTSIFAAGKLFVAQGAVQLLMLAQGATLEQASVMTSGILLLAPLYSRTARDVYVQAFPRMSTISRG